MYFYIDESGQTGLNLFDPHQPVLYYGVLSSPHNLNEVARPAVDALRERFGVVRLHANQLGLGRISSVAAELEALQAELDLTFDIYTVLKADYALISFFDQVFDQGLNKAVPWVAYWTPLRYMLLAKLACLFDQPTVELAWKARLEKTPARANALLQQVCEIILQRVDILPDARSREIISDALKWAKKYPDEIHYNIFSNDNRLQISPNLVGFQAVLHGVASRLKDSGAAAAGIVVDRQSEFNKAQEYIANFYKENKQVPWELGPGLPVMDLTHIPEIPITCTPGDEDAGLELVDVYLWLFKRHLEGKEVGGALTNVMAQHFRRGVTSEVSLTALMRRWEPVLMGLPEPTPEKFKQAKELSDLDEERRKKHLDGI
ncbi:MAG: DUF3800 domain-containing protein [Pseudomonas fluorescens]